MTQGPAAAGFAPPEPSRSSVLLAALLRRTLRPMLRGIRPGRRGDWAYRGVAAFDRLARYLGAPLGTPVKGIAVQRIQLGACAAEWIAAPPVRSFQRAILYFHGGGFIMGGPQTHRRLASRLSKVCGAPVLSLQYRQLPRVSVRDSIDDCVMAYRYLLRTYRPSEIVLAGDSAGGHLAFAVAAAARDLGLAQPAGIVAISPWIDLAVDRRHYPNVRNDPYITANVLAWIEHFHQSRFGPFRTGVSDTGSDLSGLAPALIQVGGLEILLSDAEAFTARLAADGVPCQLQVYPGQMHVFQLFADILREGRYAIREFAVFVAACTRPEIRRPAAGERRDDFGEP